MTESDAYAFERLTPDMIMGAVESCGYLSDGRLLALNSYENRVYQVGIEGAEPFIAKFYRPQRFDGSALNENDGLDAIPDINGHRDDYEILGWAVRPGDAIAFDYRTIHGALANTSKNNQRRAFSLRLVGDDTHFVRREGVVTSPPFPGVTLNHGDRLAGDEFPILRSRQKSVAR